MTRRLFPALRKPSRGLLGRAALLALGLILAAPALCHARDEHVLRVHKSARKMELLVGDRVVRTFQVGLGLSPLGDKEKQGDMRTPEGEFFVAIKNPRSDFHRFIGLSYPMPRHAKRGVEAGLVDERVLSRVESAARKRRVPPQTTSLGGYVGIHGGGAGSDWTWGCIAVSDAEVEWLFDTLRLGDRIVVLP
ncbi:MAG: L,D-transpeptidase family protein [Deltaproteobacteria bacterium]|nr:L,D-transpeptidase family protein [Deltaproteobacteria bacterium]